MERGAQQGDAHRLHREVGSIDGVQRASARCFVDLEQALVGAERGIGRLSLRAHAAALALDPGIHERIEMAKKHADDGGPSTSEHITRDLAEPLSASA